MPDREQGVQEGGHGDKPADVHASWLPRLRDAVDRAERARSRAEESSDRHLQAQRQMRSDVAAMAAAQAELAALCRTLCVPGAAAEAMAGAGAGAPAGLTAREPHEPVRRGGRGRPAEAAAGAGAEPRVTEGAAKPHAPGSVLWVGGMDASTSEAELIAAFAAWGLDAVHFPEGAAAAGRGFAFLTFSAPEEARAAQEAMDGATLVDGGKPISVQVSYNPPDGRADPSRRRPRGRRTRARGAAGGERRGRNADDADPHLDPGRAGRDGTGVREAASSSEDRDGCGPGTNGHAGSGPRPDALQQSDEGGRPQAWADAP